jgi:outer membrane protein OmpA-like peptidoglycan-associated protein
MYDMLGKTVAAAAVCAALISGPLAAEAADKGFYLGGAGGYNFLPEDSELGSVDADLDGDWAGLGALGYAFASGLRLEGEFGYRENDVDTISGASGAGTYRTSTFMTNLLYDFHRDGWPVTPYVGIGLGAARVALGGVAPVAGSTINDSDVGFAMQGIVGASLDLNRYFALTADYRHLRVPDLSYTTNGGTSVDSDYATNQIMVGLRFRFAPAEAKPEPKPEPMAQPAAPKPVPAAPAPQPEEFLVFFDFDSSRLTTEAADIVRSAANAAKQGNYARIVLTGHADRAGPVDYNFGLSRRRADAVKAELVRLGVPATEITTEAKGETEPLVPTADGVPEPQNRRVEILMQ